MPSAALPDVLADGLPPGDTGSRQVFYTSSFTGSDNKRFREAGQAAAPVGGAVVIDEGVLELGSSGPVYDGVLYTGGGLRRACGPHAVTTADVPSGTACMPVDNTTGFAAGTHLATTDGSMDGSLGTFGITIGPGLQICRTGVNSTFAVPSGTHVIEVYPLITSPTNATGETVFDSVLFDGGGDCNQYTHDWRYNTTWSLRGGRDIVRNSWFYDTPSENLTICGDEISFNVAVDLGGSFTHKSCSVTPVDETAIDVVHGNYLENVNIFGDDIMGHSEGALALSANSRYLFSTHNIFNTGSEGVLGLGQAVEDENIASVGDCMAHFPRLMTIQSGANVDKFRFVDDTFIDTPSEPEIQ